MRILKTAIAPAFALVTLLSGASEAQLIHGKLLDDQTGRPIDGATVELRTATGVPLDRIVSSNASGAFHMFIDPGSYTLYIRRIGFDPLTSQVIRLEPEKSFEATFRLAPHAMRVATMKITDTPRRERGRDGFSERCRETKGVCLSRSEFVERQYSHLADILGNVPGLRATPDGMIESLTGYRCLQFLVNRLPIRAVPEYKIAIDAPYPSLFEIVPNGEEVMGIEVYREWKEVPQEFWYYAWPVSNSTPWVTPKPTITRKMRPQDPDPCGLVNIWTRAAW